jgi:hypothetical protein
MHSKIEAEKEISNLKLNEESAKLGLRAIDQWYSMGMRHALAWMIGESQSSPSELMGLNEPSENKS